MRSKIASTLSRLTTILTLPFTFVCNHFESGLGPYRNAFIQNFPQPPRALVQKLDDLFRDKTIALAFYAGDKKKLLEYGFHFFTTAWNTIVVEHPNLEGWVLKAGSCTKWFTSRGSVFSRVYETNRVGNIIKQKGFLWLEVPATYLYHMSGFDTMREESYVVVAQKVPQTFLSLSDLPEKSRNELFALVSEVGLWDAFGNNVLVTPDQKASLIDIEALIVLDDSWWWDILESSLFRRLKGKIGIFLLNRTLAQTKES